MRTHFVVVVLALLPTVLCAQTETKGRRVEVDSATGQRRVIQFEEQYTSEDVLPIHNLILVDPIKFFFLFNGTFYRAVSPGTALGVGAAIGIWGQSPVPVQFTTEVRFYPGQKLLRGFYLAPNMSYTINYSGMFNMFGENSGAKDDLLTIGFLFGWQWFGGDAFSYSLALGLDKYIYFDGREGSSSIPFILPAVRFTLGYGWK